MRAGIRNIGNRAHNKRMQSDQVTRYARALAADARRYDFFLGSSQTT